MQASVTCALLSQVLRVPGATIAARLLSFAPLQRRPFGTQNEAGMRHR